MLTRTANRPYIEAASSEVAVPGLKFVYYDLPRHLAFWRRGSRGVELYYHLWQMGATSVARTLHAEIGFDIAHHITFCRYWSPTAVANLGIPLVWGPVGGGESTPPALRTSLPAAAKLHDTFRSAMRRLGELDPRVRGAARRCAVAIATTPETGARLSKLGCDKVVQRLQLSLEERELDRLTASRPNDPGKEAITFLCMGRLIGWKGIHLAISAFKLAAMENARLVIVGDGPAAARLQRQARENGLAGRVRFTGWLSREAALELLSAADVFVQPSLHDSGSWVTMEAMAAVKPIICLDTGGPTTLVPIGAGRKIGVADHENTVREMADAMRELASSRELREALGAAGRCHVQEHYTIEAMRRFFAAVYAKVLGPERSESMDPRYATTVQASSPYPKAGDVQASH